MFFHKKNKQNISTEEKIADTEPVFTRGGKRRMRSQKQNFVTVDEIKGVVHHSVFRDIVRNTELPPKAQSSTEGGNLFNIPKEEQGVVYADLDPEIANAFGMTSVQEKPAEIFKGVEEEQDELEFVSVTEVLNPDGSSAGEGKEDTDTEAKEYTRSSILDRLKEIVGRYECDGGTTSEEIEIIYHEDDAPCVTRSENGFMLATNKVYINGEIQKWNELFEVRVPVGTMVEVETSIGFNIPKDCKLRVSCGKEAASKFYFKQSTFELDAEHAPEPIVVTLTALEGAYLSKVGRLIECQIMAS